MNILYVCHRFPYPPMRGGKIRPFNMIRHLHDQGHTVWVASIARSGDELEEGKGIAKFCAGYSAAVIGDFRALLQMLMRLPLRTPSSMGYFYSRELQSSIDDRLRKEQIDLIIVHCSSVAQYVSNVTSIPRILDFGDMDSQKWLMYARFRKWPMALGYLLEGRKLAREERRLANLFGYCTCTTRAEQETLDGYGAEARTAWFPNGVDFDYFRPGGEKYDVDKICFVGRMDYYPNQKAALFFCKHVFPIIRARRPTSVFVIVGASPSRKIRNLSKIEGVTVTGSVPDVRPYVQDAALTVAPIDIARGTQNKIIESLAMGVPVVASPSAARGVDVVPGEHILVADSPAEYADEILTILNNPDRRARLAQAGLDRVRERHSWKDSMQRFDRIIDDAIRAFESKQAS